MAKFVIGQKHAGEHEAPSRASWNTPHAEPRRGLGYSGRMAIAFAMVSFVTVLILASVVTVVWSGVFTDYTRANVEEIAQLVAAKLAEGYEAHGEWTADTLRSVTESSRFSDDIGMQVMDADGNIMYDDTWPATSVATWLEKVEPEEDAAEDAEGAEEAEADGGAADAAGSVAADDESAQPTASTAGLSSGDVAPLSGAAASAGASPSQSALTRVASDASNATANTKSRSSTTPRGPVSTAPTDPESAVTAPITSSNGETIGQVRVWVLGSDSLLTKADTAFRERTFNAMGLAAFCAIVIAIIVGFLMSHMFTRPITRITETARRIREGDLSARTDMRGDDEIDQLGETFDEMAASLERDLKHERRLTSDVAHELRTPLMAMQATVEAMQDGVYPTDAEHLETVAAETRRLARLVQQTLDLSRLENHAAPLNLDQVDIVQLTQTIVGNQRQLFHNKGLHLRFVDETQDRPAIITCDSDMITQCIINLLSNAMRYTPEDGWVVASVRGDRTNVMISVSDTGIGIAKEDLARIFGRFWRADASRAREAGGLGVGLAVTKQIVERHHGFIAVESELEKGTTFTIHLPRELEDEGPSTTMNY